MFEPSAHFRALTRGPVQRASSPLPLGPLLGASRAQVGRAIGMLGERLTSLRGAVPSLLIASTIGRSI